jgi:DNA-binding MarR family transcriptional regulator
MSMTEPDAELPHGRASLMIDPDGIPVRRTPAPLARRFQQICVTMVAAALSGAGIVQLEWAMIIFIDEVPGIDQRRLSQAMGIDRNSVSSILERLEAKGLVERRINGSDKRARELYLTAKARDLQRRFRPKIRAANDRILNPLKPGERKLFIDMLTRLVEGNRLHARPGAGRHSRGSLKSLAAKT